MHVSVLTHAAHTDTCVYRYILVLTHAARTDTCMYQVLTHAAHTDTCMYQYVLILTVLLPVDYDCGGLQHYPGSSCQSLLVCLSRTTPPGQHRRLFWSGLSCHAHLLLTPTKLWLLFLPGASGQWGGGGRGEGAASGWNMRATGGRCRLVKGM